MTRADVVNEALIRRLCAQYGPLGVDVHAHLANVVEMVHRLDGQVENPAGLLVSWCQRDADSRAGRRAAREQDRDRYAVLMVELLGWVATERPSPRVVARVMRQAMQEAYPALNPRTIVRLRSMRAWPSRAPKDSPAQKRDAATMAGAPEESTGRSHAGSHA